MDKNDSTIDALVKQFLTSFNTLVESKDQLTRMIATCESFCNCFPEEVDTLDELKAMFAEPMIYVLSVHGEGFSERKKFRLAIKKSLPLLEWVYYRDTRFRTMLKKEYHIDDDKHKRKKYWMLADIIEMRGYIYRDVWRIFIEVAMRNEVKIDPVLLPDVSVQQITPVSAE